MIFNTNEIYAKVWKVTPSEKYVDLQISTSEKNSETEEYTYSNWLPRAIGHAANTLKNAKEGDKITITKSKFTNERYESKDGERKSFFRFLILEATIQGQEQGSASKSAPKKAEKKAPTKKEEPVKQDSQGDCPW